MATTLQINHEILRWARETTGLTQEESAQKLHIGAAHGLSPAQRLDALEVGADMPTRQMLLKMSKLYRRPLLVFYLEAPPPRGDRGEDFRQLPVQISPSQEGLVDALVRDIRVRQNIVKSALEEEDEAITIPAVGSMRIEDGVAAVSRSIQKYLEIDLTTFRDQPKNGDAFSYLRNRVESAGFFVLLIGDLGSHHSALSVDYFRGFALVDTVAPFIVINDKDAKSAWSFTLLHELAHIWIGREGVSAAIRDTGVEQFCNDVAAFLLLQDSNIHELETISQVRFEDAVYAIGNFARDKNVSLSMVAYQLYRRGMINYGLWVSLQNEFRRLWLESRASEQRAARAHDGGPSYYVVRRYHVGHALINLISRMTASGAITSTKAGKVLGVKPRNVYELIGVGR